MATTSTKTTSPAKAAAAAIVPSGVRGVRATGNDALPKEEILSQQLKDGNVRIFKLGNNLLRINAVVNVNLGRSRKGEGKNDMLAKSGSFSFVFNGEPFQLNFMIYETPGLEREYSRLTGAVSTTNGTIKLEGNLVTWDIDMTVRNGLTRKGTGVNTSVASTVSKQTLAPAMWVQGDVYKLGA